MASGADCSGWRSVQSTEFKPSNSIRLTKHVPQSRQNSPHVRSTTVLWQLLRQRIQQQKKESDRRKMQRRSREEQEDKEVG